MIKGDNSAIILAMRELLLGLVTPNWPPYVLATFSQFQYPCHGVNRKNSSRGSTVPKFS